MATDQDACAPSDESATCRTSHISASATVSRAMNHVIPVSSWYWCSRATNDTYDLGFNDSKQRAPDPFVESLYVILIISDGPQGLGILTVCVAIKIMQKECYKTQRYYYSLVIVKLQSNTTWNKKQWPVSPYPRSSVSFHLSSYHFRVRPQSETGQVCKISSHGRLSIALCLLSTGKGHKWVRSLNNHCSMWTLTRTGLW